MVQRAEPSEADVAGRVQAVRQEIVDAARAAERDPATIELVAVSKRQPLERIEAGLNAGLSSFGENYVQEAQDRWSGARRSKIRLHMIGPLQTNKAKEAVRLFDVIQTVDRDKLARSLAKEMDKQDRRPPCYVQVNTGEEKQKAGVLPGDLADFVGRCREDYALPLTGLMAIPPVDDEPALHFALLKRWADRLGLEEVSMGMSGDFAKAIKLGATCVRVGSALFGPRLS
ncbi:MAG: YggS family pyridoxal phosphate-dependent enzyme [Geminicoccaceae bacterium]